MKLAQSIFILLVVLTLASCDKDKPESAKTKVVKLLVNGQWSVGSVMLDNVDITQEFTGLTLEFGQTNYSTTNGNVIWPESGTWSFTSDNADEILRDGDLIVSIGQIKQDLLILEFDWDGTLGSGRTKSVEGHYTFTFSR